MQTRHNSLKWLAGLPLLTFSLHAELPSSTGGSSVPVIDMHTHVFNTRDLPLAGAINAMSRSWVSPSVSAVLKEALLALTAPDDLDGPLPPKQPLNVREGSPTTMALSASTNAPPRTLTEGQRTKLRGYLGMKSVNSIRMLSLTNQAQTDRALLAEAFRKAGFPPAESGTPPATLKVQSVGLDGYARFVDIMTDGHLRIAHRLMTEQYPKADLFVHHMMDMEKAYDEKPQIPFDEQMHRMTRLDQRFDGRLLHFTAFDPFRREDSLESVKRGLNAGAVGVKFYPPSGYQATANDIPDRPGWLSSSARKDRWDSRYQGLSNEQLNGYNDALFRFCTSNEIPIFTHCTSVGFEADKGYGLMSDPRFWAKVLSNHPSLRLCFGHSGGEAYWFAGASRKVDKDEALKRSFGTNVVQLCLTYSNVFCEVGYLDRILDADSAALFTNRLASVIRQPAVSGGWTFGDKLMYGTDWHMIHKEDDHEKYLDAFACIFARPEFAGYQRRFLAGNAVRFLQLDRLAADPRFTEAQRRRWAEIVGRAHENQNRVRLLPDRRE